MIAMEVKLLSSSDYETLLVDLKDNLDFFGVYNTVKSELANALTETKLNVYLVEQADDKHFLIVQVILDKK